MKLSEIEATKGRGGNYYGIDAIAETKAGARRRNRKELAARGIVIGCKKPESAKAKNRLKFPRQGKCLACGRHSETCNCDDRSEWMKKRL